MWIGNVSRRELLEVFELQGSSFPMVITQRNQITDILTGQDYYTLIWKKDPRIHWELPVIMLLAPRRRSDFLAWAATYLPSVKPFTAYCRVLEKGEIFLDLPEEDATLRNLEEGCLGLILGEAATYLNGTYDSKKLSPATCARTYSFAMARSLALGILEWDDSVGDNWISLRKLTKQSELNLSLEALESVWSIFLSVSESQLPLLSSERRVWGERRGVLSERKHPATTRRISPHLVEAVFELCAEGSLHKMGWSPLARAFPELHGAVEDMRGTREERVRSLDKYLEDLDRIADRDPLTASFIAGYLTSQVSPGSFDHASLLLPHSRALSSAILWYGLCAGLSKEAQLKRYSSGLGRRVLRDLLRSASVLDRPEGDIAISELEVLMRGEGNQALDLKTNMQGFLEVEIAPRVNSLVRWPAQIEIAQSSASPYTEREIRALVTDLNQALLKAENVKQRLSHLLDETKPNESLDKRKKKR